MHRGRPRADTEMVGRVASEASSIASSINEFYEQNGESSYLEAYTCRSVLIFGAPGRRYHSYFGPDKNLMPNDEVRSLASILGISVVLTLCTDRAGQVMTL